MEDYNGNKKDLLEGDLVQVGDPTKLIFNNTRLPEGTQVPFEVITYRGGSSFEWAYGVRTLEGENALTGIVNANGEAVAIWTPTPEDAVVAGATTRNYFYFKMVNLDKTYYDSDFIQSDHFILDTASEDNPLALNILNPICGKNLTLGVSEVIKVSAFDEDDYLEGVLTVNGSVYNLTQGINEISYTFNNPGNIQIVADVSNTDGERRRKISNIMVVNPLFNGEYSAACINEPEDFSNINGGEVYFDASSSRGIEYNVVGQKYIEVPKEYMNFYWTFSDGRTNHWVDGDDELSYKFFKKFQQIGDNWASLSLEILEYSCTPSGVEAANCNDGKDNDCNGFIDQDDPDCYICTDNDGDSYSIEGGVCGPIDCDPSDYYKNPGVIENCCDGIDNNCNGLVDRNDVVDCGFNIPSLKSSLRFYAPLDCVNGNTVEDLSGNGYNGTIFGNSYSVYYPEKGGAIKFDGLGDYILFSNMNLNSSGPFSYGAWFKVDNISTTNGLMGNKNLGPIGGERLSYFKNRNSFTCWGSDGAGISANVPVLLNTWYHVMCINGPVERTMYVNGVFQNSNTFPSGVINTGSWTVGRDYVDWDSSYMNGSIKDVVIFNRGLTSNEVSQIFSLG